MKSQVKLLVLMLAQVGLCRHRTSLGKLGDSSFDNFSHIFNFFNI